MWILRLYEFLPNKNISPALGLPQDPTKLQDTVGNISGVANELG